MIKAKIFLFTLEEYAITRLLQFKNGYIQESLNEVREKIVLNSPAAATRTDK